MMISSLFPLLFGAALALDGVVGGDLCARASLDSNNVRLGDPLTLAIDFTGTADLENIHPPAISRAVDSALWKVGDKSAKTDTSRGGSYRRLTYRVRPLAEGVIVFPALEFSYLDGNGGERTVSTRPIPVRVKASAQAALAGLERLDDNLPMPDGIVVKLSANVNEDELFRWKKACRKPTAESFARFSYPEARLNEAAALILEGKWSEALSIYRALEWRIGQTPTIERGIVAALARKHESAAVELPAWRQAFRPYLRYTWKGRLTWALFVLAGAVLVFRLCGRAIRAMAAVMAALLPFAAVSQGLDPFAEMDRMMQQAFGNMRSAMGVSFDEEESPVEIKAAIETSKRQISVGEPFEIVASVELPKTHTVDNLSLSIDRAIPGLQVLGRQQNLTNGVSDNPSNVVRRFSIPLRGDAPFRSRVVFTLSGMVNGRRVLDGRRRGSVMFSRSFSVCAPAVEIDIKALPTAGQMPDFAGIVGSNFKFVQSVDRNRVETNDVVAVTCVLEAPGAYVPFDAIPDEISRANGRYVMRTYFVADGSAQTPPVSLAYYDPLRKQFLRAVAKGVQMHYCQTGEDASAGEIVAVDASGGVGSTLQLRFAPSADAPAIGVTSVPANELKVLEEYRDWARVDDSVRAGWIRKEELGI